MYNNAHRDSRADRSSQSPLSTRLMRGTTGRATRTLKNWHADSSATALPDSAPRAQSRQEGTGRRTTSVRVLLSLLLASALVPALASCASPNADAVRQSPPSSGQSQSANTNQKRLEEEEQKRQQEAAERAAAEQAAAEAAAAEQAAAEQAAAEAAAAEQAAAEEALRQQQARNSAPSSVYYANCKEARNAGAAPLHSGDPGYRAGLDRDHDGIACV